MSATSAPRLANKPTVTTPGIAFMAFAIAMGQEFPCRGRRGSRCHYRSPRPDGIPDDRPVSPAGTPLHYVPWDNFYWQRNYPEYQPVGSVCNTDKFFCNRSNDFFTGQRRAAAFDRLHVAVDFICAINVMPGCRLRCNQKRECRGGFVWWKHLNWKRPLQSGLSLYRARRIKCAAVEPVPTPTMVPG